MPYCTTLFQTQTYINSLKRSAQRVQNPSRDRPRSAAALLVLHDGNDHSKAGVNHIWAARWRSKHYCAIEHFCEFNSAPLITAEMCIATTGMMDLMYNAHRFCYHLSLLDAFFCFGGQSYWQLSGTIQVE